jgi:hypothetical protein
MKTPCLFRASSALAFAFVIVQFTVVSSGTAQVVDPLGPAVRIVSPPNNAVFHTPVDIPIFAYVRPEPAFSPTNIEFYANGTDLGSGRRLGVLDPLRPTVYGGISYTYTTPRFGQTYCLVWTNVPQGQFALTAVAKGLGLLTGVTVSRTSPPVNITVEGAITNKGFDVVTIYAVDPIAVAGTNVSWTWPGDTNTSTMAPDWKSWPPAHSTLYTNWGPKGGLFVVRRVGDVSSALHVFYGIGGTASNGVDYAALPGYIDIPAGSGHGLIPIIPIDHGPTVVPKTVVLTIAPSPLASPIPQDYIIGIPNRAVVIIRPDWRRLPYERLADGVFHLCGTGPDGAWFAVEASTDLRSWTGVCSNQVFQGSIDFCDPDASSLPSRFYRTITLSGPPD